MDVVHVDGRKFLLLTFVTSLIASLVVPIQNVLATHIEFVQQFGTTGSDSTIGISADSTGVYLLGHVGGIFEEDTSLGTGSNFVRKYDSDDNVIWTRQFEIGGSNGISNGISANSGNIYVLGYFYNETNSIPDLIIRKYDSEGNVVWTRQFQLLEYRFADRIFAEADGFYIGGRYTNETISNWDSFIQKYDSEGNVVWTRQFGTSLDDNIKSISASPEAVYVLGNTYGSFPGYTNAGFVDIFVSKFDTEGNNMWTTEFGASGADEGAGISADSSGIYVAGTNFGVNSDDPSSSDPHSFVSKFDTEGNNMWTTEFGVSFGGISEGMAVDSSGIYVGGRVAGTFPNYEEGGFVEKINLDGNDIWTRRLPDLVGTIFGGISLHASSIYIAGLVYGTLPEQTSFGAEDAFLMKIGTDDLPTTDEIPPSARITTLGQENDPLDDGVAISSAPISFSFEVEDNIGVEEVQCHLISGQGTNTTSHCTSPISYPELPIDEYTFVVDANDAANNHGKDEFHFKVLGSNVVISSDTSFTSLAIYKGAIFQFDGLVLRATDDFFSPRVTNYGTIENNGEIVRVDRVSFSFTNYAGGIINNNAGGVIDTGGESFLLNEGTFNNHGLLRASESAISNQESGIFNNFPDGTLYVGTDGGFGNNGRANNEGEIILSEGSMFNEGTLSNLGMISNPIGSIYNSGTFNNIGVTDNGALDSVTVISNSGTINNTGTINNYGIIQSLAGTIINDGIIARTLIVNSIGPDCGERDLCASFGKKLFGAEVTISPNPFTLSGSLAVEDNGPLDSDRSYFNTESHIDGTIVIENMSTSSYFLSETKVPEDYNLIYDDIVVTFHTLLIQNREVNFLNINSQDNLTDFEEFLPVAPPDLTEEQFPFYRANAYVGLLAGIQDKSLEPIERAVDMEIIDVQVITQEEGVKKFNVTVSYANSDLNGRDPSLLRLFQVDQTASRFQDITLPDPEGHDLEAKTVTGETFSTNLLALAFEEPFLSEGFETIPEQILFLDGNLPFAKIATENTINSTKPLIPSVVFTIKGSRDLTAQELFESYLIPTYPSLGKEIAQDAIYLVPSFLIPHQESENNFILSPVIAKVHPGTALRLTQSSFVESELARVDRIEMTFAKDGREVGLSFGITDTRPPDTPPPPIDVPALFLDIDFVGDLDFSDPAVFESSPTISVLVNKTLPGFEQLDDGCVDFELLLFNKEAEEWRTIQKLRDPTQDTEAQCGFTLLPEHFSKFAVGGVRGQITTVEEKKNLGQSGGGGGGGGGSPTAITQTQTGIDVSTTVNLGAERVTVEFESVGLGAGQLKVESNGIDKLKELFDEVHEADNRNRGIVQIDGAKYSTVGTIFEVDASSVEYEGTVNLTIPYNEDEVTAIGTESEVRLLHYDSETDDWEDVTIGVDITANTVTGQLNDLSPVVASIVEDRSIGGAYDGSKPTERIRVSNLSMRDSVGAQISSIPLGQLMTLSATIENMQTTDQNYVIIVQVTDGDDVAVDIVMLAGSLDSGNNTSLDISWSPNDRGYYTLEMQIWNELFRPEALADSINRSIEST